MMTQRSLSDVLPEGSSASTDTKSVQVQRMFDQIAGSYDQLNSVISMGLHKRWKSQACDLLQLKPGDQVLDVCTGTGDLVAMLLARVGDTGFAEGLDFSENMLAIARQRYAGIPNTAFTQGDALRLPYEDNRFDGAIISFGLRNVTDIPRAIAEMARVVKPGGWVVNVDTCPNTKLPGMKLYFNRIVPLLGRCLSGHQQAYQYLSQSTEHFLTPQELKAVFEGAGLQQVTVKSPMMGAVAIQAGQVPDTVKF